MAPVTAVLEVKKTQGPLLLRAFAPLF